jgi:hypothetical protein
VIARLAAVATLSLVCAACANERPLTPMSLHDGAMHVISPAAAAEVAPARKSMAAKVLSSIAYEKVTGSITDPARLAE